MDRIQHRTLSVLSFYCNKQNKFSIQSVLSMIMTVSTISEIRITCHCNNNLNFVPVMFAFSHTRYIWRSIVMKKIDVKILMDLHVSSTPEYENIIYMSNHCCGEKSVLRFWKLYTFSASLNTKSCFGMPFVCMYLPLTSAWTVGPVFIFSIWQLSIRGWCPMNINILVPKWGPPDVPQKVNE
jgi:hypothetical protein